ncbi:MAG: hypothetical protein DI637_01410 [Citromicrobium sp.]|nr:MAG: hypothetical protein DI637_01410 [Citromicrobium sp.]
MRFLDIAVSVLALLVTLPLLLVAGLGIRLTSPGPVLYWAQRMGKDCKPFRMAKFRTMHVGADVGAQISGRNDARVFRFGAILRLTKIDELPQFWNVLIGDMSLVGPRPEAVDIVRAHYSNWMMRTLEVRPGITSPGAIYYYTSGDRLIDDDNPEASYLAKVLAPKLAIDLAYIDRRNVLRDIGVLFRTAIAIIQIILGKEDFALPKEAREARKWFPIEE